MTLSHLHSRFPTCVLVPLGLDVNLCVGTLWVSIILGFLDIREYLWLCDFSILFVTWDYLLSIVGVGHLGPTWSGGSAFSLLPFEMRSRTLWLELSLLALIFTLFIDHCDGWLHFLCMFLLYVGCHFFYDVGCTMYYGWIHLLYCIVSWIREGWCVIFSFMYYSFKPFIPCDMYSGWLRISN